MPPIVLDRVSHNSELVMEETFGPIIPIVRAPDYDEAVISNSTNFSLSSGVCTNILFRAMEFIEGLDVGFVIFGNSQVIESRCLRSEESRTAIFSLVARQLVAR